MSRGWDITTGVGAVGAGAVGGVFAAFAAFVVAGLDRLPADRASAAMRGINVTAQRGPLMLALFGTAGVCVALGYRAIRTWGDRQATLLLAGSAAYLLGAVLVTLAISVPLNNRLEHGRVHWQAYRTAWNAANDVRAVLCLLGCALLVAALSPAARRVSAAVAPPHPVQQPYPAPFPGPR